MKKIVLGVLLVVLGLFLLLDNFGHVPYCVYSFVISWKMALAAIGFVLLFDRNTRIGGVICLAVSAWFIFRIWWWFELRLYFWPMVIIFIGVLLMLSRKHRKHKFCIKHEGNKCNTQHTAHINVGSKSNSKHIALTKREFLFSSAKETWTNKDLQRVGIECLFSGVEIDLRQCATTAEIINLHISTLFSSIKLYVPEHWDLTIDRSDIATGLNDNRRLVATEPRVGEDNLHSDTPTTKVHLSIEAAFSSIELYN